MKLKRILTLALTAAMLCTLLVAVPAAAATTGFTDISDPTMAQAAETLRLLGIVSGDGTGAFRPSGTLTRAQFCKMAVEALGKGAEAEAQMNRTIFKDVLGNHWARGYINLAASLSVGSDGEGKGGEALMMGKGDGTFQPDAVITYAEAVTIMMRILGYSSKDLTSGATWYDGAIASAKVVGLTDGVSLNWYDQITRGQTAILFENMLFTPSKAGKEPYLVTSLGGQILKEAVILSLDATTDDGVTGAVLTTGADAPYKTNHAPFADTLAGTRAKLVLDKHEKVIAIQPSTAGSKRTINVVTTEATYLTAAGGEKLDVAPATTVYKDGKTLTYKDVYLNIKPSTQAVFSYSAGGKLEYVFLPTSDIAETAAVAKASGGNPFASLVGSETNYRVVKNGLSASISDVRQYDVGTYDKATKTLYVSDLRLTGVYENVAPSPITPTSVTVLGASFPVLPSAYADLSGFKIGSTVTLLLTADGQVAGAVAPSEAKSNTVGVVEMKGTSATVTPLADLRDVKGDPIKLSGETNLSEQSAAKLQGQLVTVSSSKVNQITVTRLAASGATGALDIAGRTLGGASLAENVYLYERVGNGAPVRISFSQLTRTSVPASKISYVGKDYAGRVNIIVFDDVTGDQYIYGMANLSKVSGGFFGGSEILNSAVSVSYGNGKKSDAFITGASIKADSFVGISPSLDKVDSVFKLAGWLELKSVTGVSRSSFDLNDSASGSIAPIGTVTTGNMVLPIAGNVACYNKTTKKWFDSIDEARAYSDSLTVYYDKAPQEGGKVRLIVAE